MNSFVSIYNQSGIVCSSDTDNTIFRLSKKEPLAIAVSTDSPIRWKDIITKYIREGEPDSKVKFNEYIEHFESFVREKATAKKNWNESDKENLHIIFLGYGKDDLYPSVCHVQIKVDEESEKLKFENKTDEISIFNNANLCMIGNWDMLGAILQGANNKVKNYTKEKELEIYEIYKERVIEKFKGTIYENYVIESFDKHDKERFTDDILYKTQEINIDDLRIGLQTFNIEDMVSHTENLVNANIRLNHLQKGGKGLVGTTKEIAVLTRSEGFTWIKHSLFAI